MLQEMRLVHRHWERAEQVFDHEVLSRIVIEPRKEAAGKVRRDQTQEARTRQVKSSRTGSSQNRMVSQVSV